MILVVGVGCGKFSKILNSLCKLDVKSELKKLLYTRNGDFDIIHPMRRNVIVNFLLLIVPVVVVPITAQVALEEELSRGRKLGQAYLHSQAQLAVVGCGRSDENVEIGSTPPGDGRCLGMASGADGKNVYAWWKGEISRGWLRRRRIQRMEYGVYAGALVVFLVGSGLLVRSLLRSERERRRQSEFVADFAHRLKTPLTSISLCAELARSGRLNVERREESAKTIVDEAEKLNVIVDEVLSFIKESRHG